MATCHALLPGLDSANAGGHFFLENIPTRIAFAIRAMHNRDMDIIGFIAGLFSTKRAARNAAAIGKARAQETEYDWTPAWVK